MSGFGLALALAFTALLPAASAGAEGEPEEFSVHFSLPASHGYRLVVYATAFAEDEIERRESPGEVSLSAIKGRRRIVTYRAPAVVTETALEASFGALGRIDLDLRMSGKEGKLRLRPPCRGSISEFDRGTFRGTFEFRGEEGFTSARASRIPVSPQAIVDQICSNRFEITTEDLPPGTPGAVFAGGRRSGGGGVAFVVAKSRPGGRTLVRATMAERRPGLEISRAVQFVAGPAAFRYDGALSAAAVDLPAPFSGSARYRRGSGPERRWTGNLSVDLPGRADVALVRPGMLLELDPALWSVEPPLFR